MTTTRSSRTEAILADLRAGRRNAEVAQRHAVSRQWVHEVRTRAGIPHPAKAVTPPPVRTRRHWTDDQIGFLLAHPDLPVAEVAAQIGAPVSSVRWMRRRLIRTGQLPRRPSRWDAPGSGPASPFSAAELTLVDDPTLAAPEVARRTGRTASAIQTIRSVRGIRSARRWTNSEIETLVALQDRPLAEVVAHVGRTEMAVRAMQTKLIREGRIAGQSRKPT